MPTDNLARAIVAFTALVREAEVRQQDRKRFRAAADEVALVLLQQLRVGDRAVIGSVTYEAEQVIWPEAGDGGAKGVVSEVDDQHGARALLRGDRVLVVAERAERTRGSGRARAKVVGSRLARHGDVRSERQITFDLQMATDQDRFAFAQELGAVIEGFNLTVAAEAGRLRRATTDLIALLAD